MKVIVSCENAGYPLKEIVKEHLLAEGHEVIDVGRKTEEESVFYPAAAAAAAKALQDKVAEKCILICGTGAGVSIVANKFKGVYCVACESLFTANKIPFVNNANVLAMGRNVVGPDNACAMVDAFMNNSFAKDASEARRAQLQGFFDDVLKIENENFK